METTVGPLEGWGLIIVVAKVCRVDLGYIKGYIGLAVIITRIYLVFAAR